MVRGLVGALTVAIVSLFACSSDGTRTGIITLELGVMSGACATTEQSAPNLPLRYVRGILSLEGGNDDPKSPFEVWAWHDEDGTLSRVYTATSTVGGARFGMTRWKDGKRVFKAERYLEGLWIDPKSNTAKHGQTFTGPDENGQTVCYYIGNVGPMLGKVRQDRYDPQWLTPANDVFTALSTGLITPSNPPPVKAEQAPGNNLVDPTDAPRDPGGDAPGIKGGGTGGECGQDCFSGPYAYSIDDNGAFHAQY